MTVPLEWTVRSAGLWQARWHGAGGAHLTGREVFGALADDREARATLTAALLEVPFEAVAWETPPFGTRRAPPSGELVVVESPALARARADPTPFRAPFDRADGPIATFDNLSGDATLVAPLPDGRSYPHLLAFLREAPAETSDALWAAVGAAVQATERDPVWVSTAGLGVHWLHVRLDDRPKYYRHGPYRR